VRSRNLENEEAKALYRAVKIQPQWVVAPGKQTNIYPYVGLIIIPKIFDAFALSNFNSY